MSVRLSDRVRHVRLMSDVLEISSIARPVRNLPPCVAPRGAIRRERNKRRHGKCKSSCLESWKLYFMVNRRLRSRARTAVGEKARRRRKSGKGVKNGTVGVETRRWREAERKRENERERR